MKLGDYFCSHPAHRQTDTQTDRQTDRQRQTDIQTDRQRQTDTQTDRDRQTHTQTDRETDKTVPPDHIMSALSGIITNLPVSEARIKC